MADDFQFAATPTPDDEIDFRPEQPSPRLRTSANSDGIDFQPTISAPKSAVQASGDGIDFQAKSKPFTFESLYQTPQYGPSLSERTAHVGEPMIHLGRPDNLFVDTTQIPRNPFTNELELQPPMATEEEKKRFGTIGPQPDVTLPGPHGTQIHLKQSDIDAMGRVFLPGRNPNATLQGDEPWIDLRRGLVAPQNLMTETEQRQHPILTGLGQLGEGLTTPENLAILAGSYGIGELPAAARSALSAYFAAQMAKGATDYGVQGWQAYKRGDNAEAQRLWTLAGGSAALGGMTGAHAIRESGVLPEMPEPVVPEGTISSKLAMDEALARGGRRFQDFQANEAARQGMGNLAEAERGIEVARQARINEPVDIPRTYEGPAPILGGRPAGPEPNPLEVEAARVREELAARQQPAYTVRDLRRVVPENPEEPPYYVLGGAVPSPQPEGAVMPSAGDLVGARGRSAMMSDLASRVVPKIENSLVERFGPDVLDEARQELNAAAGLASSFERPGRYFSAIGQTDEPIIREDPNAGVRHGGTWYGVGSARDMIEGMHPWFADVAEGPETLSRIVQEGQGAAYDRLLERAATHIQNERESARPVIEEFAPQLQSLALQVHDIDPELASTLTQIASGHAVGFKNLREYIEGKIHDAQTAAAFNRAIEDAAGEARESAGVEETSRPAGETRFEGGGAATARESAGSVDFEPLPEPQPINPQEVEDMSRLLGRPITAEELPEIRRRLDAERNIAEGISGKRGKSIEEIREPYRETLEQPKRQESVLPGMETAVREQREAAAHEQGRHLTEESNRPPESIEEQAGRMERESPLFRGKGPQGELYSGVHPKAIMEGARMLSRVWDQRIAQPFIDRVLKIGDKYQKAREADPAVAEGLHLLDNAPQYLRAKAAQEVHNVIGDLSRAQERLFTLMADADSRENLRVNHPQEYRQAQNDHAIQAALKKYKPLEQELTALREKMGGENLDQDYLRRVYEKHVAGVNKPTAEGKPAESGQFDRVIRPQDVNPKSREASAEYHYQKGLHEFGPAFATKFIATHLKGLRDEVAQEFLSKATMLQNGADEPRSITYGGQTYFRPDVAREMREAGAKGAKEYGFYDPTQGEKFPAPAEGRYLGPKEIVKALTDYGRREESEPGSLRRFFQEQILGFGFGVPHVFNILRRVTQQTAGGAANPQAWVKAFQVAFGKELRERGISGLNDPTFDMLAKHGAISTGEMANLKEYIGGNLNPANWARGVAQIGHKALFEPKSFGGFGGLDQRARLYVADLMRSERPELTDTQISRAVNDALGEYNHANWTGRQKLLGRFMMFPGWDFSSLRWVLQHPIRTTVPPALVVLLANRALNSLGQNREEDRYDISAIHIGDRAFSTGLLRESMARNLFRPALNYAQAKVRGESDSRALDEAARGFTSGAGGLLGMLRPDLSGFVALATNRQSLFSGKELISKQDWNTPGKILPSKALENVAALTVRHALPALDRMLDSNEDIDLRSFAGGNLGFPNYRDDAEKRLIRDTAEAERVYQQVGKLAKTNPEQARQFLKDPDNATYALFYRDLAGMTKMLNRIDQAKEAVESGKLSDAEKQSRLQAIEKARGNLLSHADGLNKLLFERRQKATAQFDHRVFSPMLPAEQSPYSPAPRPQ